MSRRNQIMTVALVALIAVLGYRMYVMFAPSGNPGTVYSPTGQFTPVDVDNPALRMDILQRFLSLEYKGVRRNIFSATLPLPPPPPPSKVSVKAAAPVLPPPPPPLTVDAKYFGYASDFQGSHRRAFFATRNNEDVFIASEGDTILGRFRVVKLTESAAEVEEVSSGRRATLILEQPPSIG
jgi:hypothetical protein